MLSPLLGEEGLGEVLSSVVQEARGAPLLLAVLILLEVILYDHQPLLVPPCVNTNYLAAYSAGFIVRSESLGCRWRRSVREASATFHIGNTNVEVIYS